MTELTGEPTGEPDPEETPALDAERRRQKLTRWAVGAGLAGAAGMTVLTLATASGPTAPPTAAAVPTVDNNANPVGVATAGGLVPSAEPSVSTPSP